MKIEPKSRKNFPLVQVLLEPGEALIAESSSLVGMSPEITMETRVRGGQVKMYLPRGAGNEAYYLNTYRARDSAGEVLIAPRVPGEVYAYPLTERPEGILVTVDSFLGCDEKVEIESAWRGANTFQVNAGLQMLKCGGTGTLILSGFGDIYPMDLAVGKSFSVKRGFLVGFTEQVHLRVRQLGGTRATMLRGQEILFELEGPGRIYLQTRSPDQFINWLRQRLP